jgi:hypothetical protein
MVTCYKLSTDISKEPTQPNCFRSLKYTTPTENLSDTHIYSAGLLAQG